MSKGAKRFLYKFGSLLILVNPVVSTSENNKIIVIINLIFLFTWFFLRIFYISS